MSVRDARTAEYLCGMASDDLIRYVPTGRTVRVGRRVYHEVTATRTWYGLWKAGLWSDWSWTYYLTKDSGSFRGVMEVAA